MTNEQLKQIEDFATGYVQEHFSQAYLYHNLDHIKGVVKAVQELSAASEIEGSKAFVLQAAAWLHDIGFADGPEHEELGAQRGRELMSTEGYGSEDIALVERLILSTKLSHEPQDELEQVLRDADMAHLATTAYPDISQRLRSELSEVRGLNYGDLEWLKTNVDFLKEHEYASPAGKRLFDAGKLANLKAQKKLYKKAKKEAGELQAKQAMSKKSTEKGRETVFRVTLRNHMQLSKIADNKANIMLSVNAIIVSVILGSLLPAADGDHLLRVPLLILLITCVVTIVMATISTIPKVTEGKYSRKEVLDKKVNLLFFGNFHGAGLEEFQWGMNELLNDEEYLYNSLSKDLYFLGTVLHRKYKYLRYTYMVFLLGMLVTMLSTAYIYLS